MNKIFTDSDGKQIEYDGSPLEWRVSAYAVIIENQRVFLVRSQNEALYDVVGGGVNLGETIPEALAREAEEEAGVTLKIGGLISCHQDFFYHKKEKKFYQTILLYYQANILGNIMQPTDDKIRFHEFVPLSHLSNYPTLPFLTAIISQFISKAST